MVIEPVHGLQNLRCYGDTLSDPPAWRQQIAPPPQCHSQEPSVNNFAECVPGPDVSSAMHLYV